MVNVGRYGQHRRGRPGLRGPRGCVYDGPGLKPGDLSCLAALSGAVHVGGGAAAMVAGAPRLSASPPRPRIRSDGAESLRRPHRRRRVWPRAGRRARGSRSRRPLCPSRGRPRAGSDRQHPARRCSPPKRGRRGPAPRASGAVTPTSRGPTSLVRVLPSPGGGRGALLSGTRAAWYGVAAEFSCRESVPGGATGAHGPP